MTPEELSEAISACLHEAIDAGQLVLSEGQTLPEMRVERPKNRAHGDWSTNIALQLGKKVGKARGEERDELLAQAKDLAAKV